MNDYGVPTHNVLAGGQFRQVNKSMHTPRVYSNDTNTNNNMVWDNEHNVDLERNPLATPSALTINKIGSVFGGYGQNSAPRVDQIANHYHPLEASSDDR